MTAPRIYRAINAVMAELAEDGIAKTHINLNEQYLYRSIDDVLNRLAPLLAKHRLCVLPRVLERISIDRSGVGSEILVSVALKVAFDLVSALDQSRHTVQAFGEALDAGDKGTSKAMSAAYKAAMLQTFCIPVDRADEADAHTHKLLKNTHEPQPYRAGNPGAMTSSRSSAAAILKTRSDAYRTANGPYSRPSAASDLTSTPKLGKRSQAELWRSVQIPVTQPLSAPATMVMAMYPAQRRSR